MNRFQAREHGTGQYKAWGVYDTLHKAWPALMYGQRVTTSGSREAAERDAARLNRADAEAQL